MSERRATAFEKEVYLKLAGWVQRAIVLYDGMGVATRVPASNIWYLPDPERMGIKNESGVWRGEKTYTLNAAYKRVTGEK